jgi:peptidyl-prolyl cis-trans isomerase D
MPQTSGAALDAWIAENDGRLTAEYEANKHRYTNLDKQVRARHILVKAGSYASEEQNAAARKKAEALQKRAAGGGDFAALARKESEDQITAKNGGDIGFLKKGVMPEPFDKALFALKVDEVSEVVETQYGFHVIKVVAIREGDVPVDEAKRELAETLYRTDWLEARARSAAADALRTWKTSGDEALEDKLSSTAEGETSALAPSLEETADFGRADTPVPGLSTAALVDAVFALGEGESFSDAPVKIGREWLIFRLVDRTRPDEAAFTDSVKDTTREVLETLKQKEAVDLYIQYLRKRATEDKALRVNPLPTQDGRG